MGKDDLMDKAIESGNPMALALVLHGVGTQETHNISQSIIDSYKKENKELKKKLEDKDEYIYRIKERFNDFFFNATKFGLFEDREDY